MKKYFLGQRAMLVLGLLTLCLPAHAEPVTMALSSIGSWIGAAAGTVGTVVGSTWATAAMVGPAILGSFYRSKR